MPDLQADFERAVADSKQLPAKPDAPTLLRLYALYKQATAGDVSGARPGLPDFVAQAKWDAWKQLEGTETEAAMRLYTELVESLK